MKREYRRSEYMYYTDGNTVRKLNKPDIVEIPDYREEEKKVERTHRRTYKQQEEGLKMSLPYVIFLIAAVCMIVMSCIKMININSEVSKVKNTISSLERQVDTLKAQTDAVEYEVNSQIDIQAVIKSATEDLGMVPVDENKIRFYTSTDGEYMKQFSDVPTK